jgi:hypothetical protein
VLTLLSPFLYISCTNMRSLALEYPSIGMAVLLWYNHRVRVCRSPGGAAGLGYPVELTFSFTGAWTLPRPGSCSPHLARWRPLRSAFQSFSHRPCQTKFPPIPRPDPNPAVRPSLAGRLATAPCALTPATIRSSFVSMTTPPTIISASVACSVSKLKIRSNSHTFSKSRSSA